MSAPSSLGFPLAGMPNTPHLDQTFGSLLVGTYITLVLYGLTVHQAFRYYRIYRQDVPRLRGLVSGLLLADTVYVVLCTYSCYHYLVTSYFKAEALVSGTWYVHSPVQLDMSLLTLRYLLPLSRSSPYSSAGFTIAVTVDSFLRETFERFSGATWMVSAAFALAVVIDVIISTTLIMTLRKSRTGFKRTDTVLHILVVTFSALSLVLAVVRPNDLIFFACNMITTMLYSNSMLAVINSRRFLTQRATAPLGTGTSIDLNTITTNRQSARPRATDSSNKPLEAAFKFRFPRLRSDPDVAAIHE
ncbi:hypothetical protein ONZ51_g4585 [Trametes cubensis]|uniref:DUF6534 domain-containing protein n=1 Tax=Trametes cubensis TaxID=1111947 RepID=A0AAD7TY13_9APHY|nr:hypothetical protein ONZ51_g4585 [Trametes cubensis]